MKSDKNQNANPSNNAGGSIGKSEQNPRSHMKNENGQHKSLTKSVSNRAKDTGAKPGNKDGLR